MKEKLKSFYHAMPGKKQHIEFFTALLTIPVLLTVIITNVNNLNHKPEEPKPTPIQNITVLPVEASAKQNSQEPTPTTPATTSATPAECKKEVGPIEITSPKEGSTINDDPLTITISYSKLGEYCAVVWSYRINGGSWSEFSDKSIAVYNLPAGEKKLELKVKSIVSTDEKMLERSFVYKNNATPTPSASPTPAQ